MKSCSKKRPLWKMYQTYKSLRKKTFPVIFVVFLCSCASNIMLVIVMDSTLLFAAVATAASVTIRRRKDTRGWQIGSKLRSRKDPRGRRIGSKLRSRQRRSVESVYLEIGDAMFCRAYWMTYTSFEKLHRLLEPELLAIHKQYWLEI